MDVLIALGITAAYGYSVISLFVLDPHAHAFSTARPCSLRLFCSGKCLKPG